MGRAVDSSGGSNIARNKGTEIKSYCYLQLAAYNTGVGTKNIFRCRHIQNILKIDNLWMTAIGTASRVHVLSIGARLSRPLPRDLCAINHIEELARGRLPRRIINLYGSVSIIYPSRYRDREGHHIQGLEWHRYSGAGSSGPEEGPSRGHSCCRSPFAQGC